MISCTACGGQHAETSTQRRADSKHDRTVILVLCARCQLMLANNALRVALAWPELLALRRFQLDSGTR